MGDVEYGKGYNTVINGIKDIDGLAVYMDAKEFIGLAKSGKKIDIVEEAVKQDGTPIVDTTEGVCK